MVINKNKTWKTFHQCAVTVVKNKILSLILENIAALRKIQVSAEPAILTGSCEYSYNFPSFNEHTVLQDTRRGRCVGSSRGRVHIFTNMKLPLQYPWRSPVNVLLH